MIEYVRRVIIKHVSVGSTLIGKLEEEVAGLVCTLKERCHKRIPLG